MPGKANLYENGRHHISALSESQCRELLWTESNNRLSPSYDSGPTRIAKFPRARFHCRTLASFEYDAKP
jgi:hypothetical protein